MIKSWTHAKAVQMRRFELGKPRLAHAVRRYLKRTGHSHEGLKVAGRV